MKECTNFAELQTTQNLEFSNLLLENTQGQAWNL